MVKERELTDIFRKVGARNPDLWASSQAQEKIPQLARFLFLRQAWKLVIPDRDVTWLSERSKDNVKDPGGEIGEALKRLLASGATESDLTTVVRVMQWRLFSALCQLMDDPGELEDIVKDVAWHLFQVDEDDQPIAVMSGLHESVLETEPSGREMLSR